MSKQDYRAVANRLNVIYLFGRWGLQKFGHGLDGRLTFPRLVPLDSWEFDSTKIEHTIRQNGMEL